MKRIILILLAIIAILGLAAFVPLATGEFGATCADSYPVVQPWGSLDPMLQPTDAETCVVPDGMHIVYTPALNTH